MIPILEKIIERMSNIPARTPDQADILAPPQVDAVMKERLERRVTELEVKAYLMRHQKMPWLDDF